MGRLTVGRWADDGGEQGDRDEERDGGKEGDEAPGMSSERPGGVTRLSLRMSSSVRMRYKGWEGKGFTFASAAVTFATAFALSFISSALVETVGPSWVDYQIHRCNVPEQIVGWTSLHKTGGLVLRLQELVDSPFWLQEY